MKGIADFADGFHPLLEEGDEVVVDAVLHEDSGRGGAYLAHVGHDAHMAPFDRLVKIRVGEHDQGGFSTRFERDVLHVYAGGLHDLFTGSSGAGESDLVDIQVRGDGVAGVSAVTVEDVDDARRKAGFFDELGEVEDAEGRLLGGFHHDGIATCKSGTQFPRCHAQRIIPGDDLPAHADGLSDRVRQFVRACIDDLAVDLVRVASIVSQSGGHFGHIFVECNAVWFTIIPCLNGGEDFLFAVNEVGELCKEIAALSGGEVTP